MTSWFPARLAILFAALASLSACGGGGGGGDDNGPNNPSATFNVSPASLTFSAPAANAAPPAPQTLMGTITGTVQGNLFINITLSNTLVSVPNVVITGSNSGEAQVFPAVPAAFGPGSHTGTIMVRACTTDASCASGQLSGSPRTVNVTYNITGLRSNVVSLGYTVNDATTNADLTRQVALSGFPAGLTWTATSDQPWLTVPASGALNAGTGQLAATINQAELDVLPNASYTASVTLTPQSGLPLTIPVTMTVDRAEVSYVSPYASAAGVSREVVIRGAHLPVSPAVSFGGMPASNVNRISDTEIRASYSASLAAGRHSVQVTGVARSVANLALVSTPAFAAAHLTYEAGSTPTRIVYDAERQVVLLALKDDLGSAENGLVRFAYAGGTWGAAQPLPIFNLTDVALSADGTEWLVTRFSPISVQHYAASDLALRRTSLHTDFAQSAHEMRLAVANDGIAIIGARFLGSGCVSLSSYRIRGPRFTIIQPVDHACSSLLAASPDGAIIVAGNNIQNGIDRYVAATGTVATISPDLGVQLTSDPVFDRHASRIVLNARRVYDASFSFLGELPATSRAAALSPDGTVAWTFDTTHVVRKFDLGAAPTGGFFQEILPATPLVASPDQDGDGGVVMTITPEGEALFIAGDDGVIVQPSP